MSNVMMNKTVNTTTKHSNKTMHTFTNTNKFFFNKKNGVS